MMQKFEKYVIQYAHLDDDCNTGVSDAELLWTDYASGASLPVLIALKDLRNHPSAKGIKYRVVHRVSTEKVMDW